MTELKYEKQVSIGGKKYPICYTTAAAIAMQRVQETRGELSKMNRADQIEAMIDIGTVMVNGAIAAHNLMDGLQEPLITRDHILFLASQEELKELFSAVSEISANRKRTVRLKEDADEKKEITE